MKRKLLFIFAMVTILASFFIISASAESVHEGRVDLNATVTLDDGTVCELFDEEGNALIWFKNGSTLQSIRADDPRVRYKATYGFNVGNKEVGTVYGYEVSDMWISLDSTTISKTGIVVLNLMDDDVLVNEATDKKYLGGSVNCVKTIQWANKILEYAFLRLDTVAIQQQAFSGCPKLKYINLEDLTELRQIGGAQSLSQTAGQSVLFKDQVLDLTRTKLYTISGSGAFNAVPFSDIKFPSTLKYIEEWSLQSTNLVSFAFPEAVPSIRNAQLKKCAKLVELYLNNTTTSISTNVFLEAYAFKRLFFVGSFEELNTLLDNTSTTGNAPLWDVVGENRCNLISYTDYLALEDKSGKYVVYDFSYCIAYNDSNHNMSPSALLYPDGFEKDGILKHGCSECQFTENVQALPLIYTQGYSYSETYDRYLLSSGYTVNAEMVAIYEMLTGKSLEVGILFAKPEDVEATPDTLDNITHISNKDKNKHYTNYNYVVTFPKDNKYNSHEFVASGFIYDGTQYFFYQSDGENAVSVLGSGFTTTTFEAISGIPSAPNTPSHSFTDWQITEATCTSPASKTRTCQECGETETYIDESAPGHIWSSIWTDDFLYSYRECTRPGCGEIQRVDWQNLASSADSYSFEGNAWGSPSLLYDGIWEGSYVAAKAVDISLEFSYNTPISIDRVYVKIVGPRAKFTVSVMYEGDDFYTEVGSGSAIGSATSSLQYPYAPVDGGQKVTKVKVALTNNSNGSDQWLEVALIDIPELSRITNEKVTVTLDSGVGSFDSDYSYELYASTQEAIGTLPIPKHRNPTIEFLGWYKDEECTIAVTENDIFKKNVTLYAKWSEDTGCVGGGAHTFGEWTTVVNPSCQAKGVKEATCTTCGNVASVAIDKIPHTELTIEGSAPSCTTSGVSDKVICAVCGTYISGGETLEPKHTSQNETIITPATKYAEGLLSGVCDICGESYTASIKYTATKEELVQTNVGYIYTGGKYTNETFTNVSVVGRISATSFFSGTSIGNLNDDNLSTFWSSDSYADGYDYSSEKIVLELPDMYDIGAIRLTVPNYSNWGLGDECYVSYAIEYFDGSEWIFLGNLSDKYANSSAQTCSLTLTLNSPINTDKIRARVTYATRYAPATIYELEVFAKPSSFDIAPKPIPSDTSFEISGKYNDPSGGAEALNDGTTSTYWFTDVRHGVDPWTILTFSDEKYIGSIQIICRNDGLTSLTVSVFENGEWVQVGGTYQTSAPIGGHMLKIENQVCTMDIPVERTASKIRINFKGYYGAYWEAKVYEIIPYAVTTVLKDAPITECTHTSLSKSKVVAPTCTEAGYTIMSCSCGEEFKSYATDKTGHRFDNYVISTPASATSLGTKTSTCSLCGGTNSISYEEGYEETTVTPYMHNAPAAWAMTFDDGNYRETYAWAEPMLAKYGFRATALVTVNSVATMVNDWNEYFSRGVFDLGSHSYSHTSIYHSSVNEKALLSEIINAQYWLRHNFKGQKVLTFAAPNGATSDAIAKYLTGPFVANRNGGQGYAFYNVISDLENGRSTWGNLNSYISKADQTEGEYVFSNADGSIVYKLNSNGEYELIQGYDKTGFNFVFDEAIGTFVNKGYSFGTYYYVAQDYKYEFKDTGSYNYVDGQFVFVNDNSGEYRLVKATVGSYEKAIDTLVSVNGFTVECIHSLGSGSIYSTYNSTVSKLEYLTKKGVWAPSYNELVAYLKEAQCLRVETVERTSTSVTVSATDDLDNYMFNQAVTIKIDIDDSWTDVTVTQNGVEIPLVDIAFYKQSKNMTTISCAIENGYIYVDIIPDGGDIVVTKK